MARDAGIERALVEWGQWLKVGDGSGYATKCVLHAQWSPPTAGQTPTMKVGTSSAAVRRTHAAVLTLSERLQETLLVHYVMVLPPAEQALRLQCQPETIGERIRTAHRLLLAALSNEK